MLTPVIEIAQMMKIGSYSVLVKFIFMVLMLLNFQAKAQTPPQQPELTKEELAQNQAAIMGVQEKIRTLYAKARRIKVDGKAREWRQFPQYQDKKGDLKKVPEADFALHRSMDITQMSLAPTDKGIYLFIATAAKPTDQSWAYNVNMDVGGDQRNDLSIRISKGKVSIRYYDPETRVLNKTRHETKYSKVVIGEVVELYVDYRDMAAHLADFLKKDLMDPNRQPFIRVDTFTYDWRTKTYPDRGPTAASYRLQRQVYDLEKDKPVAGVYRAVVDMFMPGRQYLGQGGYTDRTHIEKWSWDFWGENSEGYSSIPLKSKNNEDYWIFGAKVYAPADGVITSVQIGQPDQVPWNENKTKSNRIMLKMKDGGFLQFSHLKKGSIKVKAGDRVKRGALIAEVGNSGNLTGPHMHFALWYRGKDRKLVSYSIAMRQVIVGLNPNKDDYWNREMAVWELLEGYFVEAAQVK